MGERSTTKRSMRALAWNTSLGVTRHTRLSSSKFDSDGALAVGLMRKMPAGTVTCSAISRACSEKMGPTMAGTSAASRRCSAAATAASTPAVASQPTHAILLLSCRPAPA